MLQNWKIDFFQISLYSP